MQIRMLSDVIVLQPIRSQVEQKGKQREENLPFPIRRCLNEIIISIHTIELNWINNQNEQNEILIIIGNNNLTLMYIMITIKISFSIYSNTNQYSI